MEEQNIISNPFDGIDEHALLYLKEKIAPTLKKAIQKYAMDIKYSSPFKKFLKDRNIEVNPYQFPSPVKPEAQAKTINDDIEEDEHHSEEEARIPDPIEQFIEAIYDVKSKKMNYSMRKSIAIPDQEYLTHKRKNVFCNSYKDIQEKIETEGYEAPYHEKTQEQKDKLFDVLTKNPLTSRLAQEEMQVIVDSMCLKEFNKDDYIIKQGEDGTEYFVLDEGECECLIEKPGEEPKCIRKLSPGDGFGELALMYNAPRSATIRALNHCKVWALDRTTFKVVLMQMAIKNRNIHLNFIDKVPIFRGMNRYEKLRLLDGVDVETVKAGDYVVREGEAGNTFFIVEKGSVQCLKKESDGTEKWVRDLTDGEYFGELALVNNNPRSLSVKANVETKLLTVNRDTFNRILGSIKDYINREYEV